MGGTRPATGSGSPERPEEEDARSAGPGRVVLVGLTAMVSLQLARVFFPIVFDLGEREGTTAAALKAGGLSLIVFLAPMIAPLLGKVFGFRRALVAALVTVAAGRLAVQLLHPIPLWLAAIATAFGLWALALLLVAMRRTEGSGGGHRYVVGLVIGLALDTALRAGFSTWDYSWQEGAGPLALAVLPAAAIVVLAVSGDGAKLMARGEGSLGDVLPAALVGPFLWLQVLFLQSVAFVASATRVSLPTAAALVLVGDALAVAALRSVLRQPTSWLTRVVAGAGLLVAAYLIRRVDGAPVVVVVLIAQTVAAPFLAIALSRTPRQQLETTWRTSVAFGLGTLAFMLFLVLYQIQYRVSLPFSNTLLAPVTALLIVIGGLRVREFPISARSPAPIFATAFPLVLLVVPLGLVLARPDLQTTVGNGTSFRLVSYNVHLSIGANSQLDPEAIARAILRERPDVVALQEVPRGWAGAGTMDLAEWLSHELRMPFVFAPAADGQFGNVILSRLPIDRSRAVALRQISGAQARSYLLAEVDIGTGNVVTVIDAHLEGSQPDHKEQVETMLHSTAPSGHTIIAGDMNMQPKDPDRRAFDDAGLVSAQDATGNGKLSSAAHPNFPGDRPDWIFGSPEVLFTEFRIDQSEASDHLPLAVTVGVP